MKTMLLRALRSYFKALNIKFPQEELELQLLSNPHTPSLYAISETLDFLGIEHVAAKIEKGQVGALPENFIAFIDGEDGSPYFSHVRKKGDGFYLNVEKRNIAQMDFLEIWNGVVLLAERNAKEGFSKGQWTHLMGMPLVLLIGLLLWENPMAIAFSILGLMGLYISAEIFVTSINRASVLGKKVCGGNDVSGCEKVINSEKYNLGGFTPNDVLFAFFAATLGTLLFTKSLGLAHVVVYLLSIVGLFATIAAQAFVLKAWCRLCLLASGVIFIQAMLVFFTTAYGTVVIGLPSKADLEGMGILGLLFGMALIFVQNYRKVQKRNVGLSTSEIELLKFKRLPQIIGYVLKDAQKLRLSREADQLQFGNANALHSVTLVLSLSCKYCKDAFFKLLYLYKKRGNDLAFRIVLNHYDPSIKKQNTVAAFLIETFDRKDPDLFLEKMQMWFKAQNNLRSETDGRTYARGMEILGLHRAWCERNKIYQTPTLIIDESIIPYYYDADFLEDFLDVLSEETTQ
tara:strand:- start:26639 stop:28183 length:1545 start_codon:yes stop_codon:yes gene_type:complete